MISGHSFRIFRADGVTVAETRGGPRYDGDLFSYEPVTVLAQDPRNEESLIFAARSMTMGADGTIYVLDYRDLRIAVFAPDGTYRRSFGRRGNGPGEYRSMEVMAFDGEVFQIWWLRVMVLPGDPETGGGVSCYVLSPEGRFLGRTSIPNARSSVVRGHLLAPLTDDETEEDAFTHRGTWRIRGGSLRLSYTRRDSTLGVAKGRLQVIDEYSLRLDRRFFSKRGRPRSRPPGGGDSSV